MYNRGFLAAPVDIMMVLFLTISLSKISLILSTIKLSGRGHSSFHVHLGCFYWPLPMQLYSEVNVCGGRKAVEPQLVLQCLLNVLGFECE